MATVTTRLVPSAYTLSSTQYLTISSASNMYTNVDSTTMATIQHTRANTTAYYLYIHGFDFGSVPDDAEVTSFSIKIRAYESGNSTNSSYRMSLYNNTTAISNTTASASLSTTATTFTFPNGNLTWSTLKGYGNNFRIRVPLRRNSSSTAAYVYVYGAEISVTYTVPDPRTITTTLTGSGTIDPSGTTTLYDDETFDLTIIPTNASDTVTVTKNGVNITSQLEVSEPGTHSISKTAESLTTGFSITGINFYTSSSSTGHNFDYAIGHTAESPGSTASGSGSWTYVKTSSGSTTGTGYADFEFDFSEIPTNATINSVTVNCYGAVESSSQSTSHADITLYSGSTQKGTMQKFTSATNSVITISSPGTWTAEELHEAKLRFAVGYYGGHIFGITWTVSYTVTQKVYTYSYDVDGDATIAVVIVSSSQPALYVKINGSWVAATAVYKKVNGSWVQQNDLTSVFQSGVNYVKG